MANLTTPEELDALRAKAEMDGNPVTAGCPDSLAGDKPGETVFIEDASTCKIFNGDYNTAGEPGVVVIANGPITLGGNANFYGLIYHANVDNSDATLVTIQGTGTVHGAISIDGKGGADLGSNALNLIFDPYVWVKFEGLNVHGTASIVPNTFREISAAS